MNKLTDEEIKEFAEGFIGNGDEGIIEAFENTFPTVQFSDLTFRQLEEIDFIVQVCAGCGFGTDTDTIEDIDGEVFCEDCIIDHKEGYGDLL